ncbi:MAG: MFS transporter, partial [Thermodesulfobacteriota bacterium]
MTPDPEPTKAPAPNKWLAMLGVGLGVLMATMDVSIVNLSLPTLVTELHTDFPTIQWVILAYVVVVTSLMMGVARFGDMRGKKEVYTVGLSVFTLGSLLCGLAPSVGWLIGFRGLQGCGAVMTQALGAAIIAEVFPSSERGRALGIIGSIVSIGLALGPAFGGLLIGLAGWRSIFLVNVPLGGAALWVLTRFVPPSKPGPSGQRFDLVGAAVIFLTLGCYALGMTLGQRRGFGDGRVLTLLVSAAAGLALFLWTQKRAAQPMLDLGLFKNVLFSLNLLMSLLVFILVAGMFIMPFFLELVKGYA